jgi:hypothetical protein
MSLALYVIGYAVMVIGLAIGAHMMKVPSQWIGVGCLILIGCGIFTGVTNTRQKDS